MFVPRAASRNPRRRPRTSSDDSVKPPKAKRQRSVLRQAGDSPITNLHRDDIAESAAPVIVNEHDATADAAGLDCHLPIRNTKPSEGLKNDLEGTVALVSATSVSSRP
jgi:hypothetical protein